MKAYSSACERNSEPILRVLQEYFVRPGTVLEIGSGTGQHAVYFAARMPHLTWLATDRDENLPGIRAWLEEARLANLRGPLCLDVSSDPWPEEQVEYAFSANTAHIMSWPDVEAMFAGVARILKPPGTFCLYGPFNREGEFTSDSNRAFDRSLRLRDPAMGLRDDRDMIALAQRCGLSPAGDHAMPANNRTLVWSKFTSSPPARGTARSRPPCPD